MAAARLVGPERVLFEDLFVKGLTREEVCEQRNLSADAFARVHRSLMRTLCGATPSGQKAR